ncbi:uncharacterized protein LOC115717846 isoform X2 [Cannabis sativa]|uniref:uncharacterized protein LOC115717846 isoform X2 n=1 Tax=Cannabis sativa TaxID=3483 RepID=UPI0029CA2BD4|nr:uncharacterized protein LOC115717846 isoform X2 [Cannabis sativa]
MFHKIESTWMESISGQYTLEPGAAVSLLSAFSLPVTGLVSFPIYRYCLPQFGDDGCCVVDRRLHQTNISIRRKLLGG